MKIVIDKKTYKCISCDYYRIRDQFGGEYCGYFKYNLTEKGKHEYCDKYKKTEEPK